MTTYWSETTKGLREEGEVLGVEGCGTSPVEGGSSEREREFFNGNLLVRNHYIVVMIRWTGLAPREFAFTFSGSLTSTFLR